MNNLMLVRKDTGEVVEDHILIVGRKAHTDKGFVKIFVAFLRDIVEDKDISGKAIRLLMYIIEKMDYNTLTVYLHYEDICKELNIGQMTYYRWLNTLIRKGYIQEIKPKIYELKPYSAIKGDMRKTIQNQIQNQIHQEVKNAV